MKAHETNPSAAEATEPAELSAWPRLLAYYTVYEPEAVWAYLAENPDIVPLLVDAMDILPEVYPEGIDPRLCVFFDNESGHRTLDLILGATGLERQVNRSRQWEVHKRLGLDQPSAISMVRFAVMAP